MTRRKRFREQIKAELDERGMQLQQLADRIGVTTGYVSRIWNYDEDDISLSAMEKICDGLGIKPSRIDLYVEKMLPYLARDNDALRDTGRWMLERNGERKSAASKGAHPMALKRIRRITAALKPYARKRSS